MKKVTSQVKFKAEQGTKIAKNRQWTLDTESKYVGLSASDKDWLKKFNSEYANIGDGLEPDSIHMTQVTQERKAALKTEMILDSNSANRDLYAIMNNTSYLVSDEELKFQVAEDKSFRESSEFDSFSAELKTKTVAQIMERIEKETEDEMRLAIESDNLIEAFKAMRDGFYQAAKLSYYSTYFQRTNRQAKYRANKRAEKKLLDK